MRGFSQRRPGSRAADVPGIVERGREAYRRRAWADAYQALALADQATGPDLEHLAISRGA
jgi:hypothetical protein